MINLAICDDDELALKSASALIALTFKELRREVEIDMYNDANHVFNRLLNKKEPLDILLLDIDMPKMTGLELAEKLRAGGERLIIIFLSAHEKYVFKAIEYTPFRYVRKNFMETELPIALKAAFQAIEANADKIIILKTDNGDFKASLSQIIYYEIENRKIALYLSNGNKIITRKTMDEMRELVPEGYFIALHRACVVNANYIKSVEKSVVTLDNGQKLIMSRPHTKAVKRQLFKFWGDLI